MPRYISPSPSSFWKRIEFAGRLLCAILGGVLFAIVAWEPTSPSKNDAAAAMNDDVSTASNGLTIGRDASGATSDEWAPAINPYRKKQESLAWNATHDTPTGDFHAGSPLAKTVADDEGTPTVMPHSRGPP